MLDEGTRFGDAAKSRYRLDNGLMPGSVQEPVLASATFEVVPADIVAAHRAHLRSVCRQPANLPYVIGALALMLALGVYLEGRLSWGAFVPAAILLVWILAYHPVMLISIKLGAGRLYRQQRNLQQRRQVELTHKGVHARTPTQDSFIAWSGYIAWNQNRDIVLLYQSGRLFQMMPARALNAEFVEVFHQKTMGLPRR